MNRHSFLAQPFVDAFVAWLADRLPVLPVHLSPARSKHVPSGLDASVIGVEEVLVNYCWSSEWKDQRTGEPVRSSDWASTRQSLDRLAQWLRQSVAAGDETAAGAAAREVLRWGGVKGAIPFLERKAEARTLCAYLQTLAPLFALDGEQSFEVLHVGNTERFDAGMTKVHAVFDTTGSPIYDSRVGAAMAMLYELFRRDAHCAGDATMPPLGAPSGAARGKQVRNPKGLGFATAPQFYSGISPHEWARWQLRAGWIIRAVLERTDLFASEPVGETGNAMAARCHAMEAAFFMIGYDLRCLITGTTDGKTPTADASRTDKLAPIDL